MRTFTFKKNFKVVGFRSPDWQRAKLLFQKPIAKLANVKTRISQKFDRRKRLEK